MDTLFSEMLSRFERLDQGAKQELVEGTIAATRSMVWIPNEGPQTDAYLSEADVLLFGGKAGGGKTHLELGWCVNEARSGIIFRRELTQTDGIEKEGKQIIGNDARFNGQDLEWTWPDGRTLKLGGMRQANDWNSHAGRERDCFCFDEAGEFLEVQVGSILGWLRAEPGRRCRVILASNPPRTVDGFWLIKWFAPWLDDKFPDPAKPGELRWAVYVTRSGEGEMNWVDGPGTYEFDGEEYIAKSYTFIPSSLKDNPYRNTPEYRATLQSLPEPLRSQLLYGTFTNTLDDPANQCIPTDWIRAAQARWKDKAPEGIPMCAIGVDCTGGGDDPMVQAVRHDGWFRLVKTPGSEFPREKMGSYAAGLIVAERRDNAIVAVDMGGGYGNAVYERLRDNEIEAVAYKGAESTTRRSKDGKLGFVNTRAAAYWGLREALDPDQPGGSPIALPPDRRLLAGLAAPTFEVTSRGIKVEPKVIHGKDGKVTGGVMAKLGFSPDEADATVEAWFVGPRYATHALEWITKKQTHKGQRPVRTTGRVPLSARRRS